MVDLKILDKLGINAENWRSLLEKKSRGDMPGEVVNNDVSDALMENQDRSDEEKRDALRNRIRSRVDAGRDYNLGNWMHYYVLDRLWDAPYRNISPTMLAMISEKYEAAGDIENALKGFNMDPNKFLIDTGEVDKKTGNTIKKLKYQSFFQVTIPLVRSFLQIRRAKLINDRNLTPFLQFQALANTPENRVKSEVVTDRVQTHVTQFNTKEIVNQAVFQMLLYHRCFVFPRENWYVEEQLRFKPKGESFTSDKPDYKAMGVNDDDERLKGVHRYVVKEGIRHFIPHPTRCYYDQAFYSKDINVDIGPTYAGYWKVMRFGELKKIDGFYNLDRVSIGATDWWTSASVYFNTMLNQCAIRFPTLSNIDIPEGKDKQEWLANNAYYNQDFDDNSVVVYEHFEKLIPKDDGLGPYTHPIWARFVVAGDGTILYAAPLGYVPVVDFEDNGNNNNIEESGLGNLLSPYQDQVQNLVTQYLLTVRQNLANLTLVDENVLKPDILHKIRNLGERFFRSLNVYTFDSKKLARSQTGLPQAIVSHRFQYLDTNGILQAIRTVLDLAERVLQFSSQEVAQAASHEQTKAEVHIIANTTSNILSYTGFPVDQGMEALGRQIYDAMMNYGEDDFFVHVPSDVKITESMLKDMNLTVLEDSKKPGDKIKLRAKNKSAMRLETFAVTPALHERIIDVQSAQAMAVFLRDLMQNPITAAAIGPEQAIQWANQIAKLAGLPSPRPLRVEGKTPDQQAQQSQEMLKVVIDQVMTMVKKGIQPILENTKANEIKIDQLYQALNIPIPNVTSPAGAGNGTAQGRGQELASTS